AALDALVASMLARDRRARPAAGQELRRAIRAAREQSGHIARVSVPDIAPVSLRAVTVGDPEVTALSPRATSGPAPLPRPAYPLVGRDEALRALEERLRAQAGAVTLWGPAGIGKTRMGLELAHRWSRGDSRSASFVALRACVDAEGLLRAVAAALQPGAPPAGTSDAIDAVVARTLRARGEILLVLDGAEHVAVIVDAAIVRWAAAAPSARVLVTSRDRSGAGEVVEVGPLDTRGADSAAAAFFVARAGTVGVRIAADPQASASIERIVGALDGNPLAIQLAASRLEVLGLDGVLERVGRPLLLLGGTRRERDAGGGASTMAEALAWSWDLLPEAEQRALARCSVFAGGFSVGAAEAVLRDDATPTVVDVLQSLRDRSLLGSAWTDGAGGVRLTLSSAIRDFARAKLESLGLAEETAVRHRAHYVAWAAPLAERVASYADASALRSLVLETDQLLAALRDALPRSPADAIHTLLALDPVLGTRGPFGNHLELVDAALAGASSAPAEVDGVLVARLRQSRGRVLVRVGRHDEARADLEQAVDCARREDDPEWELAALLDLGVCYQAQHRLDEARHLYEAVVARLPEHLYVQARALGNLGTLNHDEGRFEDATTCYVEAIALFESLDDPRPVGLFLANLAMLDADRGRADDALRRYARAVAKLEAAGDPRLLGIALSSAGMLRLELGQAAEAVALHESAQRLLAEVNDPRSEALCLGRLGAALACLGRLEPAVAAVTKGERTARRDAATRDVLRVLHAFVDVEHGRRALAVGHLDEARAALEAAQARVAKARTPGPTGRAVAAASDDARSALRALPARIAELEAGLTAARTTPS
ncbi:MAG: tetratricopeptide repeat protein, partial [Polyangiaceae bacterium]